MVARNNSGLKSNLRLRMFLIFLLLTAIFWMLTKLSKSYSSEVVFNLEYNNLPVEKVFQKNPISEIKATVFSSGFKLLKYKISTKTINIDLSYLPYKKGFQYYYLPNNHLSEFKSQLNDNSVIERISRDTIFFDLGQNLTKRVPVQLDSDIAFKLGYDFVDSIKITPDSVDVIGPEKVLDTLYVVNTEKLELTDVNTVINAVINLKVFDKENVTVSNQNVKISAEVDKFTEGSLKVLFQTVNVPKGVELTTFPQELTVFYKVGLKNYNRISADNLVVICDFNQSIENNLDYLIPQLEQKTSLISSVRFVPSKIEFLIEQ